MAFFEDKFPGNTAVIEKLVTALGNTKVTAFTGAGTSMPAVPSWSGLINRLTHTALSEGLISSDDAAAFTADQDTLYVADQLSSALGERQLKSRVTSLYAALGQPTAIHKALLATQYNKFMTLNYDTGLEQAAVSVRQAHLPSITPRQNSEFQKWTTSSASTEKHSVLHWHGIHTNSEEIIFSGNDYANWYEATPSNKERLRSIFQGGAIAIVGFGFTDPFITSQLESVMRPLASDNMHFAIVGVREDSGANLPFERRRYSTKYKMEVIFYPILVHPDGSGDHTSLTTIVEELSKRCPYKSPNAGTDGASITTIVEDRSYKANLFSVGERQVYCQPNLWTASTEPSGHRAELSVESIINSDNHFCINAPHEYGLSTLGKRLWGDINSSGSVCFYKDANALPNYRKKLRQDRDLGRFTDGQRFHLVLDNYSAIEHERLLNEVLDTFDGVRVILLQRSFSTIETSNSDLEARNFQLLELSGLRRSDIRSVVCAFLPSYSEDSTSAVVDKVYTDLLQLCIPLTPSNVIMYCSILCREGDFSPVSRLHIVEKFIVGALQRAGDSYTDAFNASNKIDLICHFCHNLFVGNRVDFTFTEWMNYCRSYKEETLTSFNEREALNDLLDGRVIRRSGDRYFFRYRMFFCYFLGRHIAVRPTLLEECIRNNTHVSLDGLVEVICGLSPDSSSVLEDLTKKLEYAMESFYDRYPIAELCLHLGLKWSTEEDDQEIWKSIGDRLDEGPASSDKIDDLKTSIAAERRTIDQKVSIIEFISFEKNASALAYLLRLALESSGNARASVKVNAAKAVMKSYRLAYEVATMVAPMIAAQKYFCWNGFAYINLIERDKVDTADSVEADSAMLQKVIQALPQSIVHSASEQFGSRKLSEVLSVVARHDVQQGFERLLAFTLITKTKPEGWREICATFIKSTARDDIFLFHMLGESLRQFRGEINTGKERDAIKQVVAAIQVRRDTGVKDPSRSLVARAIEAMEKAGMLSDAAPKDGTQT